MKKIMIIFFFFLFIEVETDYKFCTNIELPTFIIKLDKHEFSFGSYIDVTLEIINDNHDEVELSDFGIVLANKQNSEIVASLALTRKSIYVDDIVMHLKPGKNYYQYSLNTLFSLNRLLDEFVKYQWPVIPEGEYSLYFLIKDKIVSNIEEFSVTQVPSSEQNVLDELGYYGESLPGTSVSTVKYEQLRKYKKSHYRYEYFIAAVDNYAITVSHAREISDLHIQNAKSLLIEYYREFSSNSQAGIQLERLFKFNKNFDKLFLDSLKTIYESNMKSELKRANKIELILKKDEN